MQSTKESHFFCFEVSRIVSFDISVQGVGKFKRTSLTSSVKMGETDSSKKLVAIDKEYVRVNSTELGEEVELNIEDENDKAHYQIILRVDKVDPDPSLFCIKTSIVVFKILLVTEPFISCHVSRNVNYSY